MDLHKLINFRNALKEHTDKYILIGGNAIALLAQDRNQGFRPTEDFDIVIVIEKWDEEFAHSLNSYLFRVGYQGFRYARGKGQLDHAYRFNLNHDHPMANDHPREIELFCREYDGALIDENKLKLPEQPRVSDFSAILLDTSYYNHLTQNTVMIEGVNIPNLKCLTLLKTTAWLNNRSLYEEGEIDSLDVVNKHILDICRLFSMYDDKDFEPTPIPAAIRAHIVSACHLLDDDIVRGKLISYTETFDDEFAISFEDSSAFLKAAFH
jgi:hypothetical protein